MKSERRPFPQEYVYDDRDIPEGASWRDIPALVRQLVSGAVPAEFQKFFDRDPERMAPAEEGVVVSPADGVLEIKALPQAPPEFIIHLRLTDVHVQRVPLAGTVRGVERCGAGHYYPDDERYWLGVQTVTTVESSLGPYSVRQITTLITRRIETFVGTGEAVRTGERLGRILLGSTVTLRLPGNWELAAAPGQRVVAGETIIARFTP